VIITGVTAHNIYGQDPLLGPLADNGGPTPTHALLPGSPAIDHGSSDGLATDQRGQPRGFNFPAYLDAADGTDIGAYELSERAQNNWVVNGSSSNLVFTVNSTNDEDDGVPGIAHCSLREAIAAANANADTNTIDFAAEVPGLHTGVTGTITLTNGQLAIATSVDINGPGAANLTVSGNNASRVFKVTGGHVAMSSLAIAGGNSQNAWDGFDAGGGIDNRGNLVLVDCIIRDCIAGGGRGGGGIHNVGVLALSRCTLTGNYGPGGGGLFNQGWFSAANCTLSFNRAGAGGAIFNYGEAGGPATTILKSCTISSNTTDGSAGVFYGGGIALRGGTVRLQNTIIAGNIADVGPDCNNTAWGIGDVLSDDFNLIGNTNGANISGVTAHNLYNLDPKLGPLADLGGPTPTHALRFDSPALDAGHSGGLTTDQRGLPRPIDDPNTPNAAGGDGSDIGAYEADPNLRITGIGKAGPNVRLSFNSLLGRTYYVESTDTLPPSWSGLANGLIGTGGRWQALDANAASQPQRFYRVVMEP
jgi:CSLREA domain-containing protein